MQSTLPYRSVAYDTRVIRYRHYVSQPALGLVVVLNRCAYCWCVEIIKIKRKDC